MDRQQAFPGYLYAKSLCRDDQLSEGYKIWFFNDGLTLVREKIEALRKSFRWRPDSSRRYAPVVVIEPGEGDRVLVVRFSDAGKDSFMRPQTLRMEALLVPVELVSWFWDGTFKAKPNREGAMFYVDEPSPAPDFPGWNGGRLVHGAPETFSLAGSLPCHPTGNTAESDVVTVEQVPDPADLHMASSSRQTEDHSKKDNKVTRKVLFVLLVLSCAVGGWNYFKLVEEIEQLRNGLKARDSDIEKHCAEIVGLRSENSKLQAKIDQYEEWIKTRDNFEVNKVKIKIKFDEIIRNFREAEDMLVHMDETPKPADRKSVMPSASLDVHGRNKEYSSVRLLSKKNFPGHEE